MLPVDGQRVRRIGEAPVALMWWGRKAPGELLGHQLRRRVHVVHVAAVHVGAGRRGADRDVRGRVAPHRLVVHRNRHRHLPPKKKETINQFQIVLTIEFQVESNLFVTKKKYLVDVHHDGGLVRMGHSWRTREERRVVVSIPVAAAQRRASL